MATHNEFIFFGRERELHQFQAFIRKRGAGFTHLRGRRRIGKSELLKKIQGSVDRAFYFMGRDDERNRETLKRFAREWDNFTGEARLTRLKVSELHWDEMFREVARQSQVAPLLVFFDEVQWLAAKGVGFAGLLKEHWAEWKKTGRVKVVLAGSSNRFFHKYTDGETAILRGLRTHAPIWVEPFTLAEIHEFYFPAWSREEICLTAMMFGGVPYYLENIDPDDNFLRAINRSVFRAGSIFLDEADAVLKLETTGGVSRRRVKDVLACVGQDGRTEVNVTERSGLGQDRVHKILERLLDYGLVRERWPLGQRKNNRSGVRFYLDDPYLNFYFQVLRPREAQIRANRRRMIFSTEVLSSRDGYYIPDFSGKAFELLITAILEAGQGDESRRTQGLFRVLGLETGRYQVGTYWDPGKTQIDIVVQGIDDRELRIIEAKWISGRASVTSGLVPEVQNKVYPLPARRYSWRRRSFLALSRGASKGLQTLAARKNVGIIELADLF